MKDLVHLTDQSSGDMMFGSGEASKGNKYWQFQDIWEFDYLKYENITNVFRITNGYEGPG